MDSNSSWRHVLAAHPLRIAAAFVALALGALALWVINAPPSEQSASTWYGDAFVARGFERRTLGRALVLPTRESGALRGTSVAVLENLSIAASQSPQLTLLFVERDFSHKIALIWRNSIEPTATQRLDLEPGNTLSELVHVASHRGWRGTITGLGVLSGHANSVPLILKTVSLHPHSPVQRFESLTQPLQFAMSRPTPGEENVARARRISVLTFFAVGALVILGAFALIAAPVARRSVWLAASVAGGTLLLVGEIAHRTALAHTEPPRVQVRPATVVSLTEALKKAPPNATLHVWSGDARGYEVALASAPRQTYVTLGYDSLPISDRLREGDVLLLLARRGVRFDPARASLSWNASDVAPSANTQALAKLVSAADGEAIFSVGQR